MFFIIISILIIVVIIIAIVNYNHKRGMRNSVGSDASFTLTSDTTNRITNRTTNRTFSNNPGGAVQMETEVVEYFANARHNQNDRWFRFKYKKVGNEWRAYIIRTPSLNGKSGDPHLTHRYSDGNGNYWVCREPQTTTLHDAQVVSRVWADRFLEYTVTGIEANSQEW